MSKRAEEAQASALLPESIISYAKEHTVLSGLIYREGVKFGYEQAEKETIERAWEWMTSAKGEHTFEDFRKAMEEN